LTVEGTKTNYIHTKVRDMQDFIEGDVEMTIREYMLGNHSEAITLKLMNSPGS